MSFNGKLEVYFVKVKWMSVEFLMEKRIFFKTYFDTPNNMYNQLNIAAAIKFNL